MPLNVDVTIRIAGGAPTIDVSPPDLEVAPGVSGKIQWRITNPPAEGWKFAREGIRIVDPGSEFDQPNGGGTHVFTWNNKHTRPGRYKYDVRVERGDMGAELDPSIVNR